MDTAIIDLDAFNQERMRLQSLMDNNPAKAIEEARSIPSDTPVRGVLYTSLKAGVLIDAGSSVKDKQAIREGIDLFRKLLAMHPKQSSFHYNLGNGLAALADQNPNQASTWYLETAKIRRKAREHLQKAISSRDNSPVLSTAFANLGNALLRAHRWAEAYDAYTSALKNDPTNTVASTGAARVLLRCVRRGMGNRSILQSIAVRHLKTAKLHPQRLAELAGMKAQRELEHLLQMKLPDSEPPDLKDANDYEKFVARHRLALSPTIDGLDCSLKRWDSLRFNSLTESAGASSGVPPLFAMMNVMKSDFLAARYLAYQALTAKFPESGLYTDTLDYAVYGIVPSLLSLAQRACIDVLDKIASATTEYFGIPGNVKVVYFWSRWFDNPREAPPFVWHPSLRPHIDNGNTAIIALADISFDTDEGGFLVRKKAFRHSSTHRFTVLHDMGCQPSRESAQIEHCEIEEFKDQLIESLQLARAAVLYFVEMVSIAEKSRAAGIGKVGKITVPSHHYIRGEDDQVE
jgi:tetratricopeptide (TPR) repeat protein